MRYLSAFFVLFMWLSNLHCAVSYTYTTGGGAHNFWIGPTGTFAAGAASNFRFIYYSGVWSVAGISTSGTDSHMQSGNIGAHIFQTFHFNGSSWNAVTSPASGYHGDFAPFAALWDSYQGWLAANSLSSNYITFQAFLDGFNPDGPTPATNPTDGPQAPPPGFDFDWEYKPGDPVPESDMSLHDAVIDGIITPEQYADLLARGFAPSDRLHYYSEQNGNQGIIVGRPNWPDGYNIYWQYNSGGSGWQSGGSQEYTQGETGWNSSGPWQPPTQAPPSDPPPSNDNPAGDITNDQNTSTGANELEELERLNDNVNNVADAVETAAQALLDQGEDTQDMMAAEAAAQAERDNIRDEELKEANRIARQQLNELQKMNAKLEEVREAVEDIETGGGGGTGGEVTVDGEVGEYDAFEGADSGLTTDAADGLAASIGSKVGPHTVDFSGPATSFSFSIPMPSGDPYAVVLPLVPQTGTPHGDALDLFRIIFRLFLAMVLFYFFSVAVIKTIRT